jgi:hypothetical protein
MLTFGKKPMKSLKQETCAICGENIFSGLWFFEVEKTDEDDQSQINPWRGAACYSCAHKLDDSLPHPDTVMYANPFKPTDVHIWIDSLWDGIKEILVNKQIAYGSGNIGKFGGLGLAVRMSDKASRLSNLSMDKNHGAIKTDESIDDTLTDIIGYALLYKMFLAGKLGEFERFCEEQHAKEKE